ncbi:MAG: hypothetical protein FD131_1523 [Rhodocyclaceae bacterium]|nr:MAG: hypothetical protein FD131_1523 [Rhodocyclaceae bacterium]
MSRSTTVTAAGTSANFCGKRLTEATIGNSLK